MTYALARISFAVPNTRYKYRGPTKLRDESLPDVTSYRRTSNQFEFNLLRLPTATIHLSNDLHKNQLTLKTAQKSSPGTTEWRRQK